LVLEDKESLDDLLETRIYSKSEGFKESKSESESDSQEQIKNKERSGYTGVAFLPGRNPSCQFFFW
jgi:hypothetical protein